MSELEERAAPANNLSRRSGWLWGGHAPLGFSLLLASFVIDQAYKWWMLNVYDIATQQPVQITPFFELVFVINKGISYGMLAQDGHGGQWALAGFALLTSIGLWIWLVRGGVGPLIAASLGLIIGGALGNALDRVVLGGVADFFHFHAYGWSWYVFNPADVAIVAGVVGLLYDSFKPSRNEAAKGS
ncbi:MAG: signal peptidase II [Hyphomicrobium sp.]|uniref:signal peptidase II n=1 Tax=Hyphomicrobium sp. CS1BSMeth3 TaxID=1892844 RepID=UPI0009FB1F48|nr:signal peptidase II [Hyphomicrobium sp. CS1BSMeth3]MBN9264296.1 signal peptidase II [Hyphomicrobium sp.]MBN9279282.1 signal peptidase II [Hyphomicrobium sp.]